jgi:hypothetical protein
MDDRSLLPDREVASVEVLAAMTVSAPRVALVAVWCLIGIGVGLAAGARGHDGRAFVALGLVLGPLLVPLLADARRQARRAEVRWLADGVVADGDVDVIVEHAAPGFDELLALVADTYGSRLRRVVVAAVVNYESAVFDDDARSTSAAELDVAQIRDVLSLPEPSVVVVPGPRVGALERLAREEAVDALVLATPPPVLARSIAPSGPTVLVPVREAGGSRRLAVLRR